MKTSVFLLALISIFFLHCCQVDKARNIQEINLASNQYNGESYDVNMIGLEEKSTNNIPSQISKIQLHDDIVYILDGVTSTIFTYNTNGKYLSQLDNIGQGPGEFLRIRDFYVKDDILYVYDDRMNKLLLYNRLNFDFLKSINSRIYFRGFIVLNNKDLLLVLPKDQKRKQLAIADSLLNIKYDLIDFEKQEQDNRTRFSILQDSEEFITYCKPKTNTVYILSKKDGAILDTLNILDANNEIEINTTPLIYKNRLMGVYTNAKQERCFFEIKYKQDKKSHIRPFKCTNNNNETLLYPVCAYKDSIVISYFDAEAYEYINKSGHFPERLEELLYNGGYVLTFYCEKK